MADSDLGPRTGGDARNSEGEAAAVLVDLGSDAEVYARDQLAQGGALATALIELPLAVGHMTTIIPRRFAAHIGEFEHGFVLNWEESGAVDDLLMSELHARLQQPGRWIVLESDTDSRGDTFLDHVVLPPLVYAPDGGVMYYLMGNRSSTDNLEYLLRRGSGYPTIGIIAEAGGALLGPPRTTLEAGAVKALAAAARVLLVGAYDQESFLICDLRRSSP